MTTLKSETAFDEVLGQDLTEFQKNADTERADLQETSRDIDDW